MARLSAQMQQQTQCSYMTSYLYTDTHLQPQASAEWIPEMLTNAFILYQSLICHDLFTVLQTASQKTPLTAMLVNVVTAKPRSEMVI